jgi:hypothetical protein
MREVIPPTGLEGVKGFVVRKCQRIREWLAFQALRLIISLYSRTPVFEMWLRRPRKSCLGEIDLSESQRQNGWHVAKDSAGYCYAYFHEREAEAGPKAQMTEQQD